MVDAYEQVQGIVADTYVRLERRPVVEVRCGWCGDEALPGTDFCTPECAHAADQAELEDINFFRCLNGHPAH